MVEQNPISSPLPALAPRSAAHRSALAATWLALALAALPACQDATPKATLTVGGPAGSGTDSQLTAGDDAQDAAAPEEDATNRRSGPDANGDSGAATDESGDTGPAGDAPLDDLADDTGTAAADGNTTDADAVEPDTAQPTDTAPETADVPATGCKSDADCDDKNVCTSDTCLVNGECQWLAAPGPCNDGNTCTAGEKCLGALCGGGVALDDQTACGDGNVCTVETCDPITGCAHIAVPGPCSDGNACTAGDTCAASTCQAGALTVCDDGNPCTADSCDPSSGQCVSQVQAGTCSDGNPCTEGDSCLGVACAPGAAKSCDDGNICTGDACNPQTGACASSPVAGSCDDGNACSLGDSCSAGTCKGTAMVCDDGNPCTTDGCTAGQCTAATMADGSPCGAQMACKGGACTAPVVTTPPSCQALKGTASSVQTLDVDGKGPLAPVQTYCEMTLSGGGWTLLAVVSDDNAATFTMNTKTLWDNSPSQIGSVAALNKDFRSPLLTDMPAKEVLFQHSSGVWAQYTFGDGKLSLGGAVAKVGGPVCYGSGKGLAMSAGTLTKSGKLCDTMLYLNAGDHDGLNGCNNDSTPEHTWGPAWNVYRDTGCFDDPGWAGSLGPVASEPGTEGGTVQGHPVGFGWAISANFGAAGTGANWMRVYAR